MLPTLKPDQDVLVLNWWKLVGLKAGDIVVIKVDGKEVVKRIHSLDDRTIYVRGDNKTDSLDSRKFGSINKEQIIGKVIWY
ncbi:S26 family signal peptidase [Candidatus Microgenomates bacterium]|nr:S26 family signal peptidase [Candidatus Microgenomates bacterium]